ncbi:MAG: hypothetical protein HZC25_08370 [Rhodospirillales bacterium]|nr:hypothetical protein [Rhodospirillales bacterium]
MVTLEAVLDLINQRLNRVLTVAQAALPPEQFKAFRRVALDEFGHSGLRSELMALDWAGKERAGQDRSERRCAMSGSDTG